MSDSEHLDRLTALWQRYRFYIIALLAMLLAAVIGFTHRHSDFLQTREDANLALFDLLASADAEAATETYDQLRGQRDFSPLADLSGFALASVYVADEQIPQAIEVLQEIADTTDDENIAALTALRLSELMIIGGQNADAVAILENAVSPSTQTQILFDERIGDAYFSDGDYEQALDAYSRAALAAAESAPFYASAIQIKIGMLFTEINKQTPPRDEDDSDAADDESDATDGGDDVDAGDDDEDDDDDDEVDVDASTGEVDAEVESNADADSQ